MQKFMRLHFASETPEVVRKRISYAFQVFAAIFGHPIEKADANGAGVDCFYGEIRPSSEVFFVPARYRVTGYRRKCELTKHRYAGQDFYLFHGIDPVSGRPDWLGEIFEWLSCSYEREAQNRDSIGRIPFGASIFFEKDISPRKPFATLLMAWMENELRGGRPDESLPKAPSPIPEFDHIVVSSHDIDFYYTDRRAAAVRLSKNMGIACRPYRSWSFAASNAGMLFDLMRGRRVGNYLPSLLERGEALQFRSSLFAVARHHHRRDPGYDIASIAPALLEAKQCGFSVGLHGSYESLIENSALEPEAAALGAAVGSRSAGNRQHWLRFDSHEKLNQQVERAGFLYDSSCGFPDRVGFRSGASFAFPPYNQQEERAHQFLEIPLAIMDGSLEATAREMRESPQSVADEVLEESRRWGWGGISLLWHNPIEALSVPKEINQVFWNCVKKQKQFRECWISGDEFLRISIDRFQAAGLLRGVKFDA